MKNAIVVVVDRLSAAYLGAYGNTWIDTPELNLLASQSILYEFALSNSPNLADAYRSYLTGSTGFTGDRQSSIGLLGRLAGAGVQTALIADEPELLSHPLAADFDTHEWVEHGAPHSCTDVTQTEIARTFAAGVEALAALKEPFLLWVHSRGLGGAWDAPYEFRQQFADEDDPDPPDIVLPPSLVLPPNHDPDDLWGYARAYAGQILVLDACCGALVDALQNSPHAASTMLVFTSPRGFPMGEHLRVGAAQPMLYNELLHVPWLIRHPNFEGATLRRPTLAQPSDLFATLLAWFEQSCELPSQQSANLLSQDDEAIESIRQHSAARSDTEITIRTPQWFYRRPVHGDTQLYVKPDDRHEANEVASLCTEIAADLDQLAATLLSPPAPEKG